MMTQKVALITGATSGIGRVTAMELLKQGWRVVVAARNATVHTDLLNDLQPHDRPQHAVEQPFPTAENLSVITLDLTDLVSVQKCAQAFLDTGLPLDALILNAGVAGQRGATAQGFELAFGVNHLGHFLLTELLLDRLRNSSQARVVTVASRAHRHATQGIDWDKVQRPTQSLLGIQEYAVSKLANIWFSHHLARRLVGTSVSTYALHPGVVRTHIWRHAPAWTKPLLALRPMLDETQGAQTTLHCTLHAPHSETGLYYANASVTKAAPMAYSLEHAATLWSKSQYFCRAYL